MNTFFSSAFAVLPGLAVPIAGVEFFGYLVAHSPFPPSVEASYPNLAAYGSMALGWLPFVVAAALVLWRAARKPAWPFAILAAITTSLFYFLPGLFNRPEVMSWSHAVAILTIGWLVVPLVLLLDRQSLPTSRSRPTR